MVKEGKIPCRRIGKSLRFPKEMIDRWLNRQERSDEAPSKIKKAVSEFAGQVRKQLENRVKKVILYGSWARDEARIDSDIDVAILVNQKDLTTVRMISAIASEVSLKFDIFLSAMVLEWESHQKGLKQGYLFHQRLKREGVPL